MTTFDASYRPPAYGLLSDEHKQQFVQKANEIGISQDELQQRIVKAWLDMDEREQLLNEVAIMQQKRAELDWQIIKNMQLMWH